jgi:hypothetical protein
MPTMEFKKRREVNQTLVKIMLRFQVKTGLNLYEVYLTEKISFHAWLSDKLALVL